MKLIKGFVVAPISVKILIIINILFLIDNLSEVFKSKISDNVDPLMTLSKIALFTTILTLIVLRINWSWIAGICLSIISYVFLIFQFKDYGGKTNDYLKWSIILFGILFIPYIFIWYRSKPYFQRSDEDQEALFGNWVNLSITRQPITLEKVTTTIGKIILIIDLIFVGLFSCTAYLTKSVTGFNLASVEDYSVKHLIIVASIPLGIYLAYRDKIVAKFKKNS